MSLILTGSHSFLLKLSRFHVGICPKRATVVSTWRLHRVVGFTVPLRSRQNDPVVLLGLQENSGGESAKSTNQLKAWSWFSKRSRGICMASCAQRKHGTALSFEARGWSGEAEWSKTNVFR